MNTLTFELDKTADRPEEGAVRVNVLIDGHPSSGHLLDVAGILFGGAAEISSFYLYTCSCGVPGCDGFHVPLRQHREADRVIWEIEDEKLAAILGASRLEFDADLFDAARRSLLVDLESLELRGLHAESLMDTDWSDPDTETRTGIPLNVIAARALPYYHGQTAMAHARTAATDPDDAGMIRFSYGLPISREDGSSDPEDFYLMPAVDAAASLLRLGDSLTPSDTPMAEALPEASAIIRSFANGAGMDEAETAFRPYRRFLDAHGLDCPEARLFGIDDQGPFVRHP